MMKQAHACGMWALFTELQLALAEVLWLNGHAAKADDVSQEGLCNVERYQTLQVLSELRQRQPLLLLDEQTSLASGKRLRSRADTTEALSQRELQVLALVALGHSNQEIANALFISLHTVLGAYTESCGSGAGRGEAQIVGFVGLI